MSRYCSDYERYNHAGDFRLSCYTYIPNSIPILRPPSPSLHSVQPKDRYVPRIFGFELHESSTELQIYQGLTTNGDDNNDGDSANSGQKEEENKDLTRGMERLNEMEKEKEDEEEEEEEEEEETGDDKEEFEEMELSDLDEND